MGRLYSERPTEQEVLDWWTQELDEMRFVGSDNSGERVEYVPRSADVIERNMSHIANVLIEKSHRD
jgi:hypothetical protein